LLSKKACVPWAPHQTATLGRPPLTTTFITTEGERARLPVLWLAALG
jgi:hypothetical protein